MAELEVETVNELLICIICMERFDDGDLQPKLLACHHSFCKQCLLRLAKNNNFIKCPTCCEHVSLPCSAPEGVHRLQTNFYVAQMQDLLNSSDRLRRADCKKHKRNVSFFCQSCEVAICKECRAKDHKEGAGHLVVDLAQAQREQRKLLEIEIAEAHHIVTVNCVLIKSLDAETTNLYSAKDKATSDINRVFDEYVAFLNHRRQVLLNQVSEGYSSRKKALTDSCHSLKQQVTSLTALSEQCHEAISNSSMSDLLAYKSKMASKNSEIRAENRNRQLNNLGNNYVQFTKNDRGADFEILTESLGAVNFTDALPSQVKLVPSRAVAGLFVNMKLVVSSNTGEMPAHYPISVSLSDLHDDIIPCFLQHQQNGCFEITFRPQVSGTHHLTVFFNDYAMPGGKFVFHVESNDPICRFGERGSEHGNMEYPRAVAIDNKNNMYVMDSGNCRITKYDMFGNVVMEIPICEGSQDYSSCGVAVSEPENLLVCTEVHVQEADMSDARTLLLFSTSGQLLNRFCFSDLLCQALSVAISKTGRIVVADSELNCVFVFDQRGRLLTKFGTTGSGPGQFRRPMFVCVGKNDDIYISDGDNNRIQVFDKEGTFVRTFGESGDGKGQFIMPFGITTDYHDNVLVVDGGNKRIQIFKSCGEFVGCIESLGDPMQAPRGIAVTTDGHVVVADRDNHCVKKFRYLHCTTL